MNQIPICKVNPQFLDWFQICNEPPNMGRTYFTLTSQTTRLQTINRNHQSINFPTKELIKDCALLSERQIKSTFWQH